MCIYIYIYIYIYISGYLLLSESGLSTLFPLKLLQIKNRPKTKQDAILKW